MYKDGKWAKKVISLQKKDGSWGYYHSLSEPNKYPMTTEQALRRLSILGYTSDDEVIKKALNYLNDCLVGKKQIPDRREKLHNWDIYTELMLSTWIRHFTNTNEDANKVAYKWGKIITQTFQSGQYNNNDYISAYEKVFNEKPRGGRLVDFVHFYIVFLINDVLDEKIEGLVFDYIINHDIGIYYIYGSPIINTPDCFSSKQSSRYLSAIEILMNYKHNKHKLNFVIDWLNDNRGNDGMWDMGPDAKDGIYFPLSNRWDDSTRKIDCTYRLKKIIDKIKTNN